jgi:outer membrane protein
MFRQLTILLALPLALRAQQPQQAGALPQQPPKMADTSFRPISLAEAIRLANDKNVSNILATNSVRSANNSVRAARAALIPNVSASAGQTKSYGDRIGQSNQIVSFTPAWSYTTGLAINQFTLFDAGKMFADIKTANANVSAAEASAVNTEFGVSLQVKLAYNSILAAVESESAAQAQLDAANVQLQTSVAKVNAGAANVSDSLRSVVQVGNAQLALLTAQNAYETAAASLTRLVGTSYFVTAQIADTIEPPPHPIDSAQVLQLALAGPTIRQEEATVVASQAAIRSAKTAYLPTVTAGFNFGGSGTSAIYGLPGSSNPYPYTRTINFALNYPLFNRFARENNIASAQINLENAQASLKDNQLAAQQNIVTAIAAIRNAEETMRVQLINVAASQEDLRVQQQRYSLGASVLLDVLNSQLELVQARQALIQARLNYRNAKAQIESYIGRDLP